MLERAEILELKKKKVLAETPYFRPKRRAFVGVKRGHFSLYLLRY